jgi:hypothetical protein
VSAFVECLLAGCAITKGAPCGYSCSVRRETFGSLAILFELKVSLDLSLEIAVLSLPSKHRFQPFAVSGKAHISIAIAGGSSFPTVLRRFPTRWCIHLGKMSTRGCPDGRDSRTKKAEIISELVFFIRVAAKSRRLGIYLLARQLDGIGTRSILTVGRHTDK